MRGTGGQAARPCSFGRFLFHQCRRERLHIPSLHQETIPLDGYARQGDRIMEVRKIRAGALLLAAMLVPAGHTSILRSPLLPLYQAVGT